MSEQASFTLWPEAEEVPSLFSNSFPNRKEHATFLRTALSWRGSVTPTILRRVVWVFWYSTGVYLLLRQFPALHLPITPFEYSGAVLGLLLVLRVNSGLDRWWEARKVWGGIVNQTRNLAIVGAQYAPFDSHSEAFLNWLSLWPYAMKEVLSEERDLKMAEQLVGDAAAQVRQSAHPPLFIGLKIAQLLSEMRQHGMDDFAFVRAERERSLLIDDIGKCERIKSTPMPLVLAIKTRRFIGLFLLLLPFALVSEAGAFAPFIATLAAYPILSLDEIGMQLQDPFVQHNLSHLPVEAICDKIKSNVDQIRLQAREASLL